MRIEIGKPQKYFVYFKVFKAKSPIKRAAAPVKRIF